MIVTNLLVASAFLLSGETPAEAAVIEATGPDCTQAARHVVDRINGLGRLWIYEDLTWYGMPEVVGQCNDQLLDEYVAEYDYEFNTRGLSHVAKFLEKQYDL